MSTAETKAPELNEKQEVVRLLSRRTWRRSFPAYIERLFFKSYSRHHRGRMRLTLVLGLALYLLAGLADLRLERAARDGLWLIRYACTTPFIAAALATMFLVKRDVLMQLAYTLAVLAAGAGAAAAIFLYPQSVAYAYGLSALIIVFYAYVVSGLRFGHALPVALLITVLCLMGAAFHQPLSGAPFQMLLAQLVVANLVAGFAGYRLEKEARRSFLHGRLVRLLHDEMIELVGVDELTGLANRRRMEESFANTWLRAQRDKAELGLLLVDVDYLQLLNDHMGRHIGDICLRKLGAVIQHYRQRPGDLAARYGGGRFLIILYGCNERHAKVIAERLRRDVESLNLMNPASPIGWTVSVSIGAHSVVPGRKHSPVSALAAADTLLHLAKKRGRNRVVGDSDAAESKTPESVANQPSPEKTELLPRLKAVK